jgi:hypothetical protein
MSLLVTVALAALTTSPVVLDVESGPKAGEAVPALKAFGVVGSIANKEADFAKDRGDAPTVYVFVQAEPFGRPTARYLKTLDQKAGEIDDTLKVVIVWLGGAADKNKEYLPKVNQSLKFARTDLAVFIGDKAGPDKWNLNSDAHVTTVVANKGKVVKSFAYVSLNETDVTGVEEALKKELKK